MNPPEGLIKYTEWPVPEISGNNELLMRVRVAALKHVDRSRASGKHYSSGTVNAAQPTVIGGDGVGLLADGTRVYAIGVSGMVAEQAIIDKDRMVILPDNLDDATASALPNAVIGSAMALRFKAKIQSGDTVLINGATGVTGRIAVQIAKHYGAKRVIATGRNPDALQELPDLGADEIVSVQQEDEEFVAQIQSLHSQTPVDIIIDYLWGHTSELLLMAFKGKGSFTHHIRFVSVGSLAGDILKLSAMSLRSVDLQLTGSGLGSWSRQDVGKLFSEILPEMFQLAADGKLKIETVKVPLAEIESVYDTAITTGKRLVIETM
ncbi:quinone oxidoreductase family protein [Runella sp.]|uniref:quinone oxidoreductase family protein n=1 Tax=Runella sp. TaxID=1960881 RepID=UPI003D12F5D0